MKYYLLLISLLLINFSLITSCSSGKESKKTSTNETILKVNPDLFLQDGLAKSIAIVPCTLSDGTTTDCYQIISKGNPPDHTMGPWCPTNISDNAEAGGIWMENNEVFDVDGAFIQNMATFYKDKTWKMYDENGDIYVTKTKEECEAAANPNVGIEYQNFCVECLPSYITDITQTYLIPVTPVQLETPVTFGGPPGGGRDRGKRPEKGERPERPKNGPPPGGGRPNGGNQASVRGLAFNGVRFDAPAPTDAILGAYTLAPFDDAGGHINLHAGYHYHTYTGSTTKIEQEDGHAAMIGYAMDGYAIYEYLDAEGKEATDLDDCRGHYDEIRGYHYHVAKAGTNSFINCFNGAFAQ